MCSGPIQIRLSSCWSVYKVTFFSYTFIIVDHFVLVSHDDDDPLLEGERTRTDPNGSYPSLRWGHDGYGRRLPQAEPKSNDPRYSGATHQDSGHDRSAGVCAAAPQKIAFFFRLDHSTVPTNLGLSCDGGLLHRHEPPNWYGVDTVWPFSNQSLMMAAAGGV